MNTRAFLILSGLTVVGVIAAAGATFVQSRVGADVQLYDEPMFPRLVNRPNDAAKVIYRTPTESATIELKDGVWRLLDKYGYPVQSGNVRSVVATIASLRKLEPKTDQPSRYASLSVEDVRGEGARSRELIIEAADGERLAAVVIGRTSRTMNFDPLGGTYVRVPGEARAWLARGTVVLPPSAVDWMERQIVHIPGPDIAALQIKEGGIVVLNTEKEVDPNGVSRYQLLPRDEKIQAADSAVKQVASAVVSLQFDDVRPAADIALPAGSRELVFTTFDGLILTATVAEVDGKTWVRFQTALKPGATGAVRAQQIQAATSGWVFVLPSFKLPAFTRLLAELTEPKAAPLAAPQLPNLPGLGRALPPGALAPPVPLPTPAAGGP